MIAIGVGVLAVSAAWADQTQNEVAACKLSLQDMLRQPKDKPAILTETIMDCGKHGQYSLEAFYGQGWRLIQMLPNGAYTNPWLGIFERHNQ